MKELVKASFLSWIGAGIIILSSIIRGKVVALEIGPSGMGTIAQLVVFMNFIRVIGTFSLSSGITQYLAKFIGIGDSDDIRRVVQTSLIIVGVFSIFLAIVVLISSESISGWLFDGDLSYASLIHILVPAVAAISLNTILQSIVSGYGNALLSSLADITTGITTIAFSLLLIRPFGIKGAVAALTFVYIARLLTLAIGLKSRHSDSLLAFPQFIDRRAITVLLRSLLQVAFASIVMASADSLSQVFVRSRIVSLYGLELNGLYQSAFGAATMVIVNGTAFISNYATSNVNRSVTSEERTLRINQAFHLVLLIVCIGVTGLILFRKVFIGLFYSPEFYPAEQYYIFQAIAEALKMLGLTIGLGLLLSGGIRAWITVGLFWASSNLILALLLLPLGAWALPLPYTISSLLYFLLTWFIVIRVDRFQMSRQNKLNILFAIPLIGTLAILPQKWDMIVFGWGLFFVWTLFALGPYRDSIRIKGLLALKSVRKGTQDT